MMPPTASKGDPVASTSKAILDDHDEWLANVDTSHIQPLKDDWDQHAFWAEDRDVKDASTAAGRIAQEMASGLTPEEKAESAKSAGNEMMKVYSAKKVTNMLRQAVDKYSEGLAELMYNKTSGNLKLRVALLSNRAQAHIHLENWRNALESAEDAIKLDPQHLKSYMRAAIAAENMQDWDKVEQHCSKALVLQPGAADITRIRERGKLGAEKHAAQQHAKQQQQEERLRPLRKVAKCIASRGYNMTRAQFGFQTNTRVLLPWLEQGETGEDVLHFPLMLYYPEKLPYHDTVEDACELDTIAAHLDMMFGESAPPIDWDTAGHYTRKAISVFYLSHAGTVLKEAQIIDVLRGEYPAGFVETGCQKTGPKASMMLEADENWTLGELLARSDYVMPGVPVLFIVAKGGDFYDRAKSFDPYSWVPSRDSPAREP